LYVRNLPPVKPEAGERALFAEAAAEALPGSPGVGFLPLVSPLDVPPGTKFGGDIKFADATPDLTHVLMKESEAPLTSQAPRNALYEWSGGRIKLVSVEPDGTPVEGGLNVDFNTLRNAISADGSLVYWEGRGQFLRDTATEETVTIPAEAGVFQQASSDGSRAFYSAAFGQQGLYVFEVQKGAPLRGRLTRIAPEVLSYILGASDDGKYVYFVAGGTLAPGAPASGCCNLYVAHETGGSWTTTFIAALGGEDYVANFGNDSPYQPPHVSHNGRYVAFVSSSSLTGYDNRDAVSGVPDNEVFLYDAQANRLACVSCNPTGARPTGPASIQGWTMIHYFQTIRQPRYLSDSGRVFFETADPLVPQATNGVTDVYEYEPAGLGSCSSANVTFNAVSGGCAALISSGASGQESLFLDASESGNDVFFITTARLVSQDVDTSYDVYDAHVCSVSVPCAPVVVSPPACTTADSCRAAPLLQPTVFGSPASATFSGAGNVAPTVGRPTVKKAKKPRKHRAKRRRKGRGKRKGRGARGASRARGAAAPGSGQRRSGARTGR
jgi:hypothetical protein